MFYSIQNTQNKAENFSAVQIDSEQNIGNGKIKKIICGFFCEIVNISKISYSIAEPLTEYLTV